MERKSHEQGRPYLQAVCTLNKHIAGGQKKNKQLFKSGNDKNRYLFFRLNNPDADVVTDITVVDMEGKATFDELKQMFK